MFSHINSLSHNLCCSVLLEHGYTLTQFPTGSGVCTNSPLLPPFSHSLSPSPDSFSDMPAQAHLAAHALSPPLFPSLPLHFSRATSPWQLGKRPLSLASSVMEWGVQGGVVVVVARRGYKEGREGNGGMWRAHPGRPGHCWQQHTPQSWV